MEKKWFTIFIVVLTIFNLSVLGTFFYKRWCHGRENFQRLKQHLGLTDEQVIKLKNSIKKFHPKIEVLSQTLKDKRLALVKELMAKNPDSTCIEQILKNMDSSQSVLQREVVNNLLIDKIIFTPEQQEKFFSIVLERFQLEKWNKK